MSAALGSRPLASSLIVAVITATLAAWVATGDLLLALVPLLLTVFVWALFAAPLHRIALVVFFLAILADNPKEHPAEGRWDSPIKPLGVFLYENLNNITGVQSLRFSGADLVLVGMVALVVLRERRRDAIPAPAELHRWLAVAWLAVVWLEVWGIARGGDFKASLWQMRPLFWTPVIAYIFSASLRGPRDHEALGKAVVAAAVIKAAFGVYYYKVVCRALGHWPAYATTHSDTVLFVTAAVIAATLWFERPTLRTAVTSVAILFAVGFGIIVNGRRLAYLSLFASFVATYFALPPGQLRRTSTRAIAVALGTASAAAVYLAVGWSSGSAFFGPARKVASLFSKDDSSAVMRDIENYNLILTLKKGLLLGSGFGHEYDELTRPAGIENIFSLYRYIGHNSILWLEAAGGFVGFTAFWTLFGVGAFFAARSYRFAAAPLDRTAALTSLAVVVIFAVQAHGDMGLNSWAGVFFLGMSIAVASKLAVASGAFPRPGRA